MSNEKVIFKKSIEKPDDKIMIFNTEKELDRKELNNLINKKNNLQIIDEFLSQVEELHQIKKIKKYKDTKEIQNDGVWVYFPWDNAIVHTLKEDDYNLVRSSRNQNLITETEQQKFRDLKIGIAGLSVGNAAAMCIALEGGGRYMKLADNDTLALSNMNRLYASIADIGIKKVKICARKILEINPFANLEIFSEGIKKGNEEEYLLNPKIDLLIEEMDDLGVKVSIRQKAKKYKIPVIMVTGNGENVILDIERYDQNDQQLLLNGSVKQNILDDIESGRFYSKPMPEKITLMRDFIGEEYLTDRLKQSFKEVGINLAGIPQLAETLFLRGAILTNIARKIAIGENIKSGRYYFKL